jgi:hypothetical protein
MVIAAGGMKTAERQPRISDGRTHFADRREPRRTCSTRVYAMLGLWAIQAEVAGSCNNSGRNENHVFPVIPWRLGNCELIDWSDCIAQAVCSNGSAK